ncbi:MAG: MCE family protein, partial [Alphaproteobacteria bacterium]
METRAHYLLIGGFVLALVVAMFGFVIWLARLDVDQEYTRYDIYFDGAVSGLTKGSTVRLNGVPVGQVTRITIPPEDPSKVKVVVKIRSDVPITEGAVARLEVLGFTGVSFVQIRGAQGNRRLKSEKPGEHPVIPSERSPIQQVFEEAPDLVNEAILAINALRQLLSDKNRAHVAAILANLDAVTAALAEGRADLAAVPGDARHALDRLGGAAERIASAADAIERVTRDEGGPAVAACASQS